MRKHRRSHTNTRRWNNNRLMLGQRLRRWPNIRPSLFDMSCDAATQTHFTRRVVLCLFTLISADYLRSAINILQRRWRGSSGKTTKLPATLPDLSSSAGDVGAELGPRRICRDPRESMPLSQLFIYAAACNQRPKWRPWLTRKSMTWHLLLRENCVLLANYMFALSWQHFGKGSPRLAHSCIEVGRGIGRLV